MEIDFLTYEPTIENFDLLRDIYEGRNGTLLRILILCRRQRLNNQ